MFHTGKACNQLARNHVISITHFCSTCAVVTLHLKLAEGGLSSKTGKIAGYGFTWGLVEAMKFLPVNLFVDSPDGSGLNV